MRSRRTRDAGTRRRARARRAWRPTRLLEPPSELRTEVAEHPERRQRIVGSHDRAHLLPPQVRREERARRELTAACKRERHVDVLREEAPRHVVLEVTPHGL